MEFFLGRNFVLSKRDGDYKESSHAFGVVKTDSGPTRLDRKGLIKIDEGETTHKLRKQVYSKRLWK